MRLFVAINLSEEMKNCLTGVQKEWRRARITGNYTPKENFHLTLAFIGEYPAAEKVADLLSELDFSPFTLETEGIGTFGELWWAGLKESDALKTCAALSWQAPPGHWQRTRRRRN